MNDRISALIKVKKIRYYNDSNNFGIICADIVETTDEIQKDKYGQMIVKGIMPELKSNVKYTLNAKLVEDSKWGYQYEVISMYTNLCVDVSDLKGQREFLHVLFTDKQIDAMYAALENPYMALYNKEASELVKIKGVGLKTANKWLERFHENIDKSRVFVELKEYNLTANMVEKLYEHYKSADVIIKNVKQNPYTLIDIHGIGWKKCDELALKGGMGIYSKERVTAFVKRYLYEMAEKGCTYVYANEQLMDAIVTMLGEDIPDEPILETMKDLDKFLWWNEDRSKVAFKKNIELEEKIAQKLIQLKKAENTFNFDGWEEIISEVEKEQGWEYTDQQYECIRTALIENVFIVTGGGGTGKTSFVRGVLRVLWRKRFAQCALAGRAAARLAEVTGEEGFTIHRLLGFPLGDKEHGGFVFYEGNYLPYDIIICDEISMVDSKLFYRLIDAIKPGSKLIMLGDTGQLECIGSGNIAHDLIESQYIPSINLTKIHRQAEASAIITDSLKIRKNIQVIDKDFVGHLTKGDLQDLEYNCYSDANNTYFNLCRDFAEWINKVDSILDLQVIVPIRERQSGIHQLNAAFQELYNPRDDEEEIIVRYSPSYSANLRVGDKVMYTANTYKALLYDNQWEYDQKEYEEISNITEVFNGSIGIIEAINCERNEIVVNFQYIGKILILSKQLSSVELSYAITVHKSQGSQYPYVLVGLDFGSYSMLTKELIYTAITRASKHCKLECQTNALRYAVGQNAISSKQTYLVEAIEKVEKPIF